MGICDFFIPLFAIFVSNEIQIIAMDTLKRNFTDNILMHIYDTAVDLICNTQVKGIVKLNRVNVYHFPNCLLLHCT